MADDNPAERSTDPKSGNNKCDGFLLHRSPSGLTDIVIIVRFRHPMTSEEQDGPEFLLCIP
jgi:hypothetical protein